MPLRRNGAILAILGLVGACAGNAGRPAAPVSPRRLPLASERTIDLEPLRIRVVEDAAGRAEVEAYDARDLFDQAGAALGGESWDQALGLYDRLITEFPSSTLVVPALFNAGLAHEGKADWAGAEARYQHIVKLAANPRDLIAATMRIAAVAAERGEWEVALLELGKVVSHRAATPGEKIEALARRGYVLVELKHYPAAEVALLQAIDLSSKGAHREVDWFRAMAHFYLADIPRRQAAAVPLRLPDAQLRADLEAKAKLVVLAQQRFESTIGLGNVFWATAAGHQLASMHEDMWRALIGAPVPPRLKPDEATIYRDEVRALARPHLERALEIHTKNVKLAERYRTESPWSEGSRQRIAVVADLMAREARGERPGPDDARAPASEGVSLGDPERYVPARIDL